MPFMLLPFRPTSDTSASRNFVRNFFKAAYDGTRQFQAEGLATELRLTEPLVRPIAGHVKCAILTAHRRYAAS